MALAYCPCWCHKCLVHPKRVVKFYCLNWPSPILACLEASPQRRQAVGFAVAGVPVILGGQRAWNWGGAQVGPALTSTTGSYHLSQPGQPNMGLLFSTGEITTVESTVESRNNIAGAGAFPRGSGETSSSPNDNRPRRRRRPRSRGPQWLPGCQWMQQ